MLSSRKQELSLLKKCYESQENEALILYGVEGIGKTSTVNEFCKDKKNIYFFRILNLL